MCGIYGVTQNNVECIQGLIKDSWYRGPDASDIYNTDEITLGHNLLAITADAKVGKQPWKTPGSYHPSYCESGEGHGGSQELPAGADQQDRCPVVRPRI